MKAARDKSEKFSQHNRIMDVLGELGLSGVDESCGKGSHPKIEIYVDSQYMPRHERQLFRLGKRLFADCIKKVLPDAAGKRVVFRYFNRSLQEISIKG